MKQNGEVIPGVDMNSPLLDKTVSKFLPDIELLKILKHAMTWNHQTLTSQGAKQLISYLVALEWESAPRNVEC
eukprot:11559967-Ditylum_brightwellii.AAC.1